MDRKQFQNLAIACEMLASRAIVHNNTADYMNKLSSAMLETNRNGEITEEAVDAIEGVCNGLAASPYVTPGVFSVEVEGDEVIIRVKCAPFPE